MAQSQQYCLLNAVRSWPYRKLPPVEHHAISRFFDTEAILSRGWQLYGIPVEQDSSLLVAFPDVKRFFDVVEEETGISIPSRGKGLIYGLGPTETSHVVALGFVNSPDSLEVLKNQMAIPGDDETPTPRVAEEKEKAKQAKKARNRNRRLDQFAGWRKQLTNVTAWTKGADSKIFIALDVESYESAHNIITEIGISVFDPVLGPNVKDINDIHTRHLRIKENRGYRNGSFVSDAAERFDFGTSEFISIRDAPSIVATAFKHTERDVVLIGHDLKEDINYLRQLGYNVHNINNLVTIDTVDLWRGLREKTDGIGLSRLCDEFGIDAWNLHNAGNDAHYTMLAYLAMALEPVPQVIVAK